MGSRLRRSFLRDVIEYAERRGPGSSARLLGRLPERLRSQVDLAELRLSSPADTLVLDEGEELLLSVDGVLGDGSGRLLEGVMAEFAARTLGQAGFGVSGDVIATLSRLRVLLERPFAGGAPTYELTPTATGFLLTVGMPGQPRSARVLRALTAGLIRAAHAFCREAESDPLRLFSETIGDRVRLEARYKALPASELPIRAESTRPPAKRPRTLRPPATPLSDEVERIMARAGLSSPPPLRPPTLRIPAVRMPTESPFRAVPEGTPEPAHALDKEDSARPGRPPASEPAEAASQPPARDSRVSDSPRAGSVPAPGQSSRPGRA